MHNDRSKPVALGVIALVLMACVISGQPATSTPGGAKPSPVVKHTPVGGLAIPPVYVTVAGHIEDTPVYAQCEAYPDFRASLLTFAESLSGTGVAVNLQIDYEFLFGTSRCETDTMREVTDGRNVIDYLVARYGFEIDAHQEGGWEEGQDNYADVRFLGGTLTPDISDNVGGLVWDSPEQFARLANGESGRMYPEYTWSPQVLTLAVSHDHHLGDFSRDDIASGVWIPAGAGEHFWAHDPDGRMVYVGPGEHANWKPDDVYLSTPEFVQKVSAQLEEGGIDRDRMYTASIAVPQSVILHPDQHHKLLALLDQMAPLVESGRVQYVTYSQAVSIWREEYGARPNIYHRDGITPAGER